MATALVVVVVIVVVVLVGVSLSRRRTDPVESFQRQIDALGPEARRPTIDQVRRADDAEHSDDADGDPDDGSPGGRGRA